MTSPSKFPAFSLPIEREYCPDFENHILYLSASPHAQMLPIYGFDSTHLLESQRRTIKERRNGNFMDLYYFNCKTETRPFNR